jgi:filamentous hemagglutinin family protein
VSREHRSRLVVGAIALVTALPFSAAPVAAQVVTQLVRDGSVGPNASFQPSGVAGVYEIGEVLGERPGGGSNLFHSFELFDVGAGDTALFTAGFPTDHVITRVTGGFRSDIAGTIASDIPGADVWLLNPDGVLFGKDAELDVQGGFRVSSADVLIFDDLEWPTGVASTGLLSIQAPAAYGFTSPDPQPITFDRVFDLAIPSGETFSAVGGDIEVIGSFGPLSARLAINAPGSLVEFASLAGPGTVPVDVASLDVDSLAPEDLGRLRIRNGATLNAGRVVIRAGQFELLENSQIKTQAAGLVPTNEPAADIAVAGWAVVAGNGSAIESDAFNSGKDGGVRIEAGHILVDDKGAIKTSASGAGEGGPVELLAENGSVTVTGGSTVSTKTRGNHVGGDIIVRTADLVVEAGGQLVTLTDGAASMPAGGIDVEADTLTVATGGKLVTAAVIPGRGGSDGFAGGGDIRLAVREATFASGGLASAGAEGGGDGGGIRVEGAESLLVTGIDGGTGQASGLFARVAAKATGRGGDIFIDAKSVAVANGGVIDASTFSTVGTGPAGDITIVNAESVEVSGGENGTSQIGTRGHLGPGGVIYIDTDSLKLTSGGILTSSTSGPADAGKVEIHAKSVELTGMAGADPSAIISLTNGGPGKGGDILVDASESVSIRDGAVISAKSGDSNSGPSGNIDIETTRLIVVNSRNAIQADSLSTSFDAGSISIDAAKKVTLENSSISTSSEFTSGGNITIRAGNYIDLYESEVSASVGGAVPENSGGDVSLISDNVIVDHSTIAANAPAGSGGNVAIDSEGFFISGGDLREVAPGVFESNGSRIDVSGALEGGTLEVTSPATEIIGNLTALSSDFLDVSGLLTEQCALRDRPAGSLIVGGRDRAPAAPGDRLRIFYLGEG